MTLWSCSRRCQSADYTGDGELSFDAREEENGPLPWVLAHPPTVHLSGSVRAATPASTPGSRWLYRTRSVEPSVDRKRRANTRCYSRGTATSVGLPRG